MGTYGEKYCIPDRFKDPGETARVFITDYL